MEWAELKKQARKQIEMNEPDFIKDADEVLNVGYLEVNSTQKVIFSLSTFKNKKYFDIRQWVQAETGEWTPTKKGVHLSFDRFDEFAKTVKVFSEIIALDQ